MDAPREQRIVAEVDARNDVCRAERDLLRLGEEVVRVPVQDQAADRSQWNELFGDDLGGVEHVEAETLGLFFSDDLQAELPFGIVTGFDRIPEVAPMEVRIGA